MTKLRKDEEISRNSENGIFGQRVAEAGVFTYSYTIPSAAFAAAQKPVTATSADTHGVLAPLPVAEVASLSNMALPTDPFLNGSGSNSQWYAIGTWGVHADKVWADYTGAGITVADLDDGFQTNHPDLSANLSTSLSYNYLNNSTNINPGSADASHGTAVMGVMIAANNGIGTVGIAYGATGVGIVQGYGSSGTLTQTLKGFQWAYAKDVDVMNNSWGYTSPYADDFNKVFSGTSFSQVRDVMKNMVDLGRDNLGEIIVFSAGNARGDGDNTNYHNFQNSPYVITVAATDYFGNIASFSTPGTSILVSAGGVNDLTTDRTGADGYNSNTGTYAGGNYALVNGTSFSAPTVSGVVALMLQANHNLGWRDVQQILAFSAQHNDPTNSGWQYNGATNWNGGGLHYSDDYGYGTVDALAAVRLAETWKLQQTSANMTTITGGSASPASSVSGSGASSTIAVSQDIDIEHVLVNLNISSSQAGSLVVTLISPDGTRSVLADHAGNGSYTGIYGVTGIQFQATTVADWGEHSIGNWTLQVTGTSGTLNSWSISFMGASASSNDLYVYTNDFGSFSGAELTARSNLADANGGTDTINLAAVTSSTTLNMNANTNSTVAGKALHIAAGTIIENAYLGDGDDIVTGNAADNFIFGGRGHNTLDGGAGNDTAAYLLGISSYSITIVSATVVDITQTGGGLTTDVDSNFEIFMFAGVTYTLVQLQNYLNIGNTTFYGTSAADKMAGTSGADTMLGGLGNDTYTVNDTGDVVTESLNQGTDLVLSSVTFTLGDNVENITLTGSDNINATGNALNNVLTGNAGNNILNGMAGADRMAGGAGDDTYIVDASNDTVTEAASAGTDLVLAGVSFTLGANVENLTLTGTAAINGTGNTLANILTGNSGNNILNGMAGADTMIGGAGDDTYVVDNVLDVITEGSGAGTDLVQSGISYTLGDNLENLTLTGSAALNGTGNALNNVVTGNSGANILNGMAGADTMIGLGGNDTYIIDNTGDVVIEGANAGTDTVYVGFSYTLSDNVENLNATGNALANYLAGNSGANTLAGLAGNDTYVVDNTGDVIVEGSNAGTDLVLSSLSYALGDNLENLTLTGTAAINATGNALNNILTGNAVANILDGGAGIDTMIGGAGNDTYIVDNIKDVVTEGASAGTDVIYASVSFTASTNVENLTLTGTAAINATGNALNNILTGNSGNNILNGMAGADTMIGGAGDDTYVVDSTGDVVTEGAGAGTDLVQSSVTYTLGENIENLTLTGSATINGTGNGLNNAIIGNGGANTLSGGAGDDILSGGAGKDTYIGGLGADTFVFSKGETVTIQDFNAAQGDKIDITAVLTGFSAGVSNIADFISLTTSGSNTLIGLDANGAVSGVKFVTIGTLVGVTGLSLQTLVDSHQITTSHV